MGEEPMGELSLDAKDVAAIRELLDLLGDHDESLLPRSLLPWSFLLRLKEVIGCDDVSFVGMEARAGHHYLSQMLEGDEQVELVGVDPETEDPAFWAHYWGSAPCSYPDTSGDHRSVTRASDFCSSRELHETAMYQEYFAPLSIEHELMMCLPDGAGRSLRLLCFRGPGRDFGERERFLLQLLRPHVGEACRAAARRCSGTESLTQRQVEILELVRRGHSNRQIARHAGISEGTVRAHLNGIFSRLGVDSRTAAANRLPFTTVGEAVLAMTGD